MNIPVVRPGVVAVSRDCFPIELSRSRRQALVAAAKKRSLPLYECPIIVENERDVSAALDDLRKSGVNALIVFLGNFGPEAPETMLAQRFGMPVMFVAAAEESIGVLASARGDALCGMLNASYNIALRSLRPYIPEYPVGTAEEVAEMIEDFMPIARIILGLSKLKIITFGPRPQDFLACNAPIKPLFDLGVEIQENSELDLYAFYKAHNNDKRIPGVIADMEKELGAGNKMPGILPRLAQYELTLKDWVQQNKGACEYVAMANKCWPAFQTEFGFVPCYVNSRFGEELMPIGCEVDIYGALSEYILACATQTPSTLLDINNSVPAELYEADIKGKYSYTDRDVFMAFHCGNTSKSMLCEAEMKYQLIMHRGLEPDKEPDITRGTLEGDIRPGNITFFRLHSSADAKLMAYIAEGEVLPVATHSFGAIGVFAIPQMARFYRHVLIGKHYPHHGAVALTSVGRAIYPALQMIGVEDISYNRPAGVLYDGENPFK